MYQGYISRVFSLLRDSSWLSKAWERSHHTQSFYSSPLTALHFWPCWCVGVVVLWRNIQQKQKRFGSHTWAENSLQTSEVNGLTHTVMSLRIDEMKREMWIYSINTRSGEEKFMFMVWGLNAGSGKGESTGFQACLQHSSLKIMHCCSFSDSFFFKCWNIISWNFYVDGSIWKNLYTKHSECSVRCCSLVLDVFTCDILLQMISK